MTVDAITTANARVSAASCDTFRYAVPHPTHPRRTPLLSPQPSQPQPPPPPPPPPRCVSITRLRCQMDRCTPTLLTVTRKAGHDLLHSSTHKYNTQIYIHITYTLPSFPAAGAPPLLSPSFCLPGAGHPLGAFGGWGGSGWGWGGAPLAGAGSAVGLVGGAPCDTG